MLVFESLVFLQLCHEPHCPYSELPIKCPRNNFKLPGETMSSADIVDEFAYSHQTWAVEFIEGWQVFMKPYFNKNKLLPFFAEDPKKWIRRVS